MGRSVKVLLIGSEIEENLAIRYLASSLEAHGHSTTIAPCSTELDFDVAFAEVAKRRPDLIAISMAFQTLAPLYLDLVRTIRQRGYRGHILVGGHFPTFEFREILQRCPEVDSVGRFEGEATVVGLAEALAGGKDLSEVPNLVYRQDGRLEENACSTCFPDLNTLPFPKRLARMQQRLGENFATLVSSRGCWHSACAYCCIGAFHKRKETRFALRSADNIAREIAELVEKHGVRVFQFHDDNFTLANRDLTLARIESLSAALRGCAVDTNTLGFLIKARPDAIDEEVGDALRDLGCTGVFLGVENASTSGLAALGRATKIERIEQAIEVLQGRDVAVTYNLLVFHPKAAPDEFEANIRFVEAHPHQAFDFGRAEIVAGSPLEKRVRTLRLLRGAWPQWDYVLIDPVMNRMFEAYRYAFRRPCAPYNTTVFAMIALGYHTALVKKLCPGPRSQAFASDSEAAIRAWNATVVAGMKELQAVSGLESHATAIESLRLRIDENANAAVRSIQGFQVPMITYQRVRGIFRRFGVEDALDSSVVLRRLLGC